MSVTPMPLPPSVIIDSEIPDHALDNVIWSALTSQHGSIAEGDDLARRYPSTIGPFAAMPDTSPASFAALARLLTAEDQVALFTVNALTLPEQFEVVFRKNLDQMVGPTIPGVVDMTRITPLGAADVDDMKALVELAQPGPFGSRTHELGRYLGVRVDGQLAAMAGERMHLDGYTEISAVCADPAFRGRGYPGDLIVALSNAVLARGELPFLHVLSENEAAIALYKKLGFTRRRAIQLTIVRRARQDVA